MATGSRKRADSVKSIAKTKKTASKKVVKKTDGKAEPKRGLRKFDRKAKKAVKKSASNLVKK